MIESSGTNSVTISVVRIAIVRVVIGRVAIIRISVIPPGMITPAISVVPRTPSDAVVMTYRPMSIVVVAADVMPAVITSTMRGAK
jgi:hypothetical protein